MEKKKEKSEGALSLDQLLLDVSASLCSIFFLRLVTKELRLSILNLRRSTSLPLARYPSPRPIKTLTTQKAMKVLVKMQSTAISNPP
jgi:hypothetical protein